MKLKEGECPGSDLSDEKDLYERRAGGAADHASPLTAPGQEQISKGDTQAWGNEEAHKQISA